MLNNWQEMSRWSLIKYIKFVFSYPEFFLHFNLWALSSYMDPHLLSWWNASSALVWLVEPERQSLQHPSLRGSEERTNSLNQKHQFLTANVVFLLHEGNYVKLSLQFTHSHLCFFADWEAEVLQNFHHGQFNHHQSKSRPHAAPWPSPKWKVSIRVDVLLVFFTKSVKQIEKICQIPTIYMIFSACYDCFKLINRII